MGIINGDSYKHHLNFHLHIPHMLFHHHHQNNHHQNHHNHHHHVPKGCVAVLVGQEEEEQKRFIIPVMYMNHPLFMQLLKEAEEEYGFEHNGPINIPCHIEEFQQVQGMINKEKSHHHHHHHHHHSWCFKA